ncbi:15004_t:CDS:2 [Funneliformis caledonium]|uniref:15004_t:CDS:1 n=1 Tax=Funneliformis caledonium TaxID=1117310 RepID=A0A9N9E2J1_9GLOM|nr:15004_t:CDS:2 [Funneliformis caledonium]
MEESKFSEEVIEQIKDIIPWGLSDENNLLIDKLILNDNLKTRYKTYGLCRECYQPNTSCDTSDFGYVYWCQSCNATRFEQDFKNWTSGDHHVDELVQKSQLKAKNYKEVIEWYNYQFEDVKTLIKDKSGITYTASWYGDLCMLEWDYVRNSWKRYNPGRVILRYLHDEPDNPVEFLKKVESRIAMNDIIQRCWDADPSNRPNANELYSLLYKFGFDAFFVQSSLAYRQVLEAYKINSSSFTGIKDIKLHPQAVYTSKLLTFKDLPNPQNADVDQI